MTRQSQPTAFVTGASSRIGKAAALTLARSGFRVNGTGRTASIVDVRDGIRMIARDVTSDASVDNDIMVPTPNSHDLARRIPGAELVIYPDAGHGGIFQYNTQFVPKALAFLAA